MSIRIEKTRNGYIAHATPPHVRQEWHGQEPLGIDDLIQELRSRGAHTTDISDAFYEADPDWVSRSD